MFIIIAKHNNINTYHQEDLNVEAVIALTNAIEQYNPIAHKNTPLSTIIEQHINEHLNCINNKQAEDLLFNLNTQSPTTNQTDCIINIDNIINSSYNISNAYAQTTFINDIINQINNIKIQKNKQIFKMFLGLGYDRKYSKTEIARSLGCTKNTVASIIAQQKSDLLSYINKNYPTSLPTLSSIIKSFSSKEERNKYIINSYYGINGYPKKSTQILLEELGISRATLNAITRQYKLNANNQVENNNIANKYTNQDLIDLLNDYYGKNGHQILSPTEILKKYNLTNYKQLRKLLNDAKLKLQNKSNELVQQN